MPFAERNGKRIWLTGTTHNDARRCKAVPGASANYIKGTERFSHWSYPLTWSTCTQLRERFGESLEIGPDLWAWAKAEKRSRAQAVQVARNTAFDLPTVAERAPKLAAAMASRTYQQVGSAFLCAVRRGIIGDDPGLGKTIQVMGAMVEADVKGPILVAAPTAAVQVTWPAELRQWLPEDRVYVCVGNRAQRERTISAFLSSVRTCPDKRHWLIVNFEMCRAGKTKTKLTPEKGPFTWTHTDKSTKKVTKGHWHHPYAKLFRGKWSAIILDESQRVLITKTPVRTEQTQVRAGLGMLHIREGGFRIPTSGTPFRGKVENLWGTLNWVYPEKYTAYWPWISTWFETYQDEYSRVVGDLEESRKKEFYEELDTVMIRRRKSEVVKELPPKQYPGAPLDPNDPKSMHGIWLEMDARQAAFYRQMSEEAYARLDSGNLIANGVLSEMTRLKQFAVCSGDVRTVQKRFKRTDPRTGIEQVWWEDVQVYDPHLPSNKFAWLLEWLDEQGIMNGESDKKVVIASQFTKIIDVFRAELTKLGVYSWAITGATTAKARVAAKEGFQAEGGPQVFFLNTDAGGVSLTLDAADDLIFLDEKWIPDDQTQVEDRIHRVSRMHQVNIWYVRSLGTIEERIGRVNEERDSLQLAILDGRRGVDVAKRLIGA